MKRKLFIYGAGGLGREILSLVRALEGWEVQGFIDDGREQSTYVKGIQILGGVNTIEELPEGAGVIFAIGDPLVKKQIIQKIRKPFFSPVLIHPSAILQDVATIDLGAGTIITAGTILTCDIVLGEHVLINLNTTIGHDSIIGSYTSVMPGVNIAGEVKIGQTVLLGSSCNIRNKVTIGDNSRVGMGAVVLQDVAPDKTVAGIPAKSI